MATEKMSRRTFLQGAAAGALATAGAGVLAGQSAKSAWADEASDEESEEETSTTVSASETFDDGSIEWDKQADLVIVGSGTGLIAALAATDAGGSVIVLEKAGATGGVTWNISGCTNWVPGNNVMLEEGYEENSDEDVLQYLKLADAYQGSSDERKLDYIVNAKKVLQYYQDEWGFTFKCDWTGDYYNNEYAVRRGRAVSFWNEEEEAFYESGYDIYQDFVAPLMEERDVEFLTSTPASALFHNASGEVTGVLATTEDGETLKIGANKGVLLSAGGFDWNEDMVRRYLNVPIGATQAYSQNTGDGIRMGQAVGADLENMSATWGGSSIITNTDGTIELSDDNVFDYGTYRGCPFCITVNKHGNRFFNESCAYAPSSNVYDGYDSGDYSYLNVPAYMIFSDNYVQILGWPDPSASFDLTDVDTSDEARPDFVQKFDTLEELAETMGINAENLENTVTRFNTFCETGTDEDFHRGEGPYEDANYDLENGYAFTEDAWPLVEDLPNRCLGPITSPYYVVVEAPGSVNTCGGIRVNTNFQALDPEGEPIPGLYASGSNCGGPNGSCYGGAGGSIGPGFYGAFRAACSAMGVDLVDFE